MRKRNWMPSLLVLSLLLWAAALGLGGARAGEEDDYAVTNLATSMSSGAQHTGDTDLVNAWGIAASPTGPWWVADNGTGKSTLYDGAGTKQGLVVNVPGSPTGMVWNGLAGWTLRAPCSGRAVFIFASEDGTISGWSSAHSSSACVMVDDTGEHDVFKGLALATDKNWIYATDFHNNRIEVYDQNWNDAPISGSFENKKIERGYAPFGIQFLGGSLFVTYAKQDKAAHDDVHGHGHGFVAEFDTDGNLIRQVDQHGELNSPWGMTWAPADFGQFSNMLLVGNFGDGHINAYERDKHGHFQKRGHLKMEKGDVAIDGLWGIGFGNGGTAGPTNALYFAAGPNDEGDGMFGRIDWSPEP